MKQRCKDECQACTQLASGMRNAKVPHDDRCRDRIGELMAEDDDQRQVEPVSSRAVLEVEIPRPEAEEETDVGEPTIVEDQRRSEPQSAPQSVSLPVPTVSGWIIRLRNPIWSRFESK